ncbi:hypothetical protein [Longimicrobium sp.]|uniref:hypothetical protein n=1 Tax=Longimicrobium sp. TaxID=2029185 RepID=UPI003B3BB675
MKHYKASFKGDKSVDEIHNAVGRGGGLVTRVHSEKGETHVYFTGGEGHEKNLRALGVSSAPAEVSEDAVRKIG